MPDYVDIKITDDDLTLDVGGEPELIYDSDCIVQDVKHLIRDSGLLVEIIGQRDVAIVRSRLQSLKLLVEEDKRLIPGTIKISQTDLGVFFIVATTYLYGQINLKVNA